jgi:hypothetical protein
VLDVVDVPAVDVRPGGKVGQRQASVETSAGELGGEARPLAAHISPFRCRQLGRPRPEATLRGFHLFRSGATVGT